jgi:hypothetical protein
MTYEATLSVDLSEWSFEVAIEKGGLPRRAFARQIPDHRTLGEYALGRRRLSVMVGDDKVFLPRELWQALLGEIEDCQNALRRCNERSGVGCEN